MPNIQTTDLGMFVWALKTKYSTTTLGLNVKHLLVCTYMPQQLNNLQVCDVHVLVTPHLI